MSPDLPAKLAKLNARQRQLLLERLQDDTSKVVIPPSESDLQAGPYSPRSTQSETLTGNTLHELFLQTAQRKPESVAVICGENRLSYASLKAQAEYLAAHLLTLGVTRGDRIGIHLTRTEQLPIAILGVLMSGAAFTCLDPSYPKARLGLMATTAELCRILSDGSGSASDSYPAGSKRIQLPLTSEAVTASAPLPEVQAADLAMIPFTSGSTGVPKAAQIEHRGLVNLVRHFARHRILEEEDTVYAHASISFDVGVRDVLFPLLLGSTSIIATEAERLDLDQLRGRIQKGAITYLNATPTYWRFLIEREFDSPGRLKAISTGEPLGKPLARSLLERYSEVWNLYGPTEVSMLATYKRVTAGNDVSIGTPIDGLRCEIIDSGHQVITGSEPGELTVAGVGVSRPYLNSPGNSDSFIPCREDSERTGLTYRTGDLVRRLSNGELEFLGRIDDQLSYNGTRIEPGEIESCLLELPSIRQVALKIWPGRGSQRLAAYLLADGSAPSIESLTLHAAGHLPTQMIPSDWIFLESIPLTKSSKTDFGRLPSPNASASDEPEGDSEDGTMEVLRCLWRDLLDRTTIANDDNFFFHGGNSLLAMHMLSKLPAMVGGTAQLAPFLKQPTIEGLAGLILTGQDEHRDDPSSADVDAFRTSCSLQQIYFWTLHQLLPAKESLNCRCVVRFRGNLNSDTFKAAVSSIIEKNEIYRTSYHEIEGTLEALIHPSLTTSVDYCTPECPEMNFEYLVSEAESRGLNRPFMLESECPLRLLVLKVGDDDHVVFLSIHHIACDGGSWNLFWRDLVNLYHTIQQGHEIREVPPEQQYSSLVARQKRRQPSIQSSLEFWRRSLRSLPPYPIKSTGSDTGYTSTPASESASLEIPADLWGRIQGSSLHNFFMACFFAWQHSEFGASDFTIGTPINSRAITGDFQVHGCAINMLPIRQRIDPTDSFKDLHGSVAESMIDGIEHHEFSMVDLLLHLGEESQRHELLYQSIFQLRNIHEDWAPFDESGSTTMLAMPRLAPQIPLMLEVYPPKQGRAPFLLLTCDTRYYTNDEVDRMSLSILELIKEVSSNPQIRIGDTLQMDGVLRHQLTETWAKHSSPYPRKSTVPQRHRQIAERFPDNTALVHGTHEISYLELRQLTVATASRLAASGITTGQRIGLMLERSPELIVAALALLELGAIYVPIDVDYPPERVRMIRDDARLATILTDDSGVARLLGHCVGACDIATLPNANTETIEAADISAESPAYIMYTSGTTGTPKGVVLPHRAIIRLVVGNNYADLGPDQTFLQLASPSFDATTFEWFAPLLNGGKLVLMPTGAPSLDDIGDSIRRHDISTLWLTAGLFHLIVDQSPEILGPLKQLLAGGDVLSPTHVRRCLDDFPNLVLINGYGPTENTTFSCSYRIPHAFNPDCSVPIGRAIANSETYILNKELEPVPVGQTGELWVGGDGLALGYWGRPELEAERFIPHPFSDTPGARIYRTGDLARHLHDGNIQFLHRTDSQVKIRGFRIELEEVEQALRSCSSIEDACAFLQGEDAHSKTLCACVIPKEADREFEPESVRRELSKQLPAYMMPSIWSVRSSLPLTRNGKIDRARLARDISTEGGSHWSGSPPENDMEETILEIWQRIFQNDHIGCEDDFFALGGNSLLAMRYAAEISRELDRKIPLNQLFRNPTIRSLATSLFSDQSNSSTLVPLRHGDDAPALIITHGQGGKIFGFVDLAAAFEAGQPVFGIQAVEHANGEPPLTSFEELGMRYAQDIIKEREGPYYLCGYSLGSFIAFETARQLQQMGKVVARLFVIDGTTINIPLPLRSLSLASILGKRLSFHASEIKNLKPTEIPRYLARRQKSLKYILNLYLAKRRTPPEHDAATPQRQPEHYEQLFHQYSPRSAKIPTTLFLGNGKRGYNTLVWSFLTRSRVQCHKIGRDHHDILNDSSIPQCIADTINRDA